MRAFVSILTAALVLAAPAPVLAQSAAKDGGGSEAKPSGEEKLVCRREAALGTRMSKRICKTRAQWRAEEEATAAEAKRFMGNLDDQGSRAGAGAGDSVMGGT